MYSWETIWIKKEETDEVATEPGSPVPEDPLNIEEHSICVKQEPELDHQVDGSEYNVVTSTRYEADRKRLIRHSVESCHRPFEETTDDRGLHSEHETGAEDLTHCIMSNTPTQVLTEEEQEDDDDRFFSTKLKCNSRDGQFHKLSCSVCLQSFTSKYRLIMHVFNHIDGIQPPTYICKSCGQIFPSTVGLKRHLKMNEVNQGKRRHKCDVCGNSFNWLYELKSHTLTHTGMRPYKCDTCGKTFTRSSTLNRHNLIHTGMRLHKCDICGESFTRLFTLKRHNLTHTGQRLHKCDICGKSFTLLQSLKDHLLLHTGMRPHKCDICGKSFIRSNPLKKHLLIHSGVQPQF